MNDSADEKNAALFAALILQQSNMALLMMGKVPDPSTGQTHADLDKASLFIDMLAMLEARTHGNLSKDEERMLKDTLTQLRMAYVETAKAPPAAPPPAAVTGDAPKSEAPPAHAGASSGAEAADDAASPATEDGGEDASRKKFTKKY